MNNQLKNLRDSMDHTVFKEAHFNNKQKEIIRGKIKKKKSFHFAPTVVFTLFVMTIVAVSLIYMEQERSANYRAMDHDLEDVFFQNLRNGPDILFSESQLFLYNTHLEEFNSNIVPKIQENPYAPSYPTPYFDNIKVQTSGNMYTIYTNNEFLMTLEKIAPRIVQDGDGKKYSSSSYLSKSYEIKFINESNINIFAIELVTEDESYVSADGSGKSLANGQSLPLEISRDRNTVHRTAKFDVAITFMDSQNVQQRIQLNEPFILDNSYSDFYEIVITGDSYDTLVLSLKEEAAE
ncbi:hypothetical protein [Solibacillus sp. CAU 1738]|uniref:hypothetical protein n=1 Tax=Solibacillus sp. CAU 1738 TaxID=3140363 RepID=UPI003260EBE3